MACFHYLFSGNQPPSSPSTRLIHQILCVTIIIGPGPMSTGKKDPIAPAVGILLSGSRLPGMERLTVTFPEKGEHQQEEPSSEQGSREAGEPPSSKPGSAQCLGEWSNPKAYHHLLSSPRGQSCWWFVRYSQQWWRLDILELSPPDLFPMTDLCSPSINCVLFWRCHIT